MFAMSYFINSFGQAIQVRSHTSKGKQGDLKFMERTSKLSDTSQVSKSTLKPRWAPSRLHTARNSFKTNKRVVKDIRWLGAGALATPLIATQFAQMRHWSFHFLVSLCFALINTVNLINVFRFKTHDGV
jgi:hypothetical protein